MRLTPVRCDLCGKLVYLEESTVYRLELKGASDWVKADKYEYDLCIDCKEALLDWIDKKLMEARK